MLSIIVKSIAKHATAATQIIIIFLFLSKDIALVAPAPPSDFEEDMRLFFSSFLSATIVGAFLALCFFDGSTLDVAKAAPTSLSDFLLEVALCAKDLVFASLFS